MGLTWVHIFRFDPVHRFDSNKKTKEPNVSGSGVGFQFSEPSNPDPTKPGLIKTKN